MLLDTPSKGAKGSETMIAKRYNVASSIRNTLVSLSVSTVRLVDAVNAALGDCEVIDTEAKLGDSKISKATKSNHSWFKVTETQTIKMRGEVTPPRLFDAWNSAIQKAEKIASFDSVAIPTVLLDWVLKFKVEEKKEEVSA